MLVNNYSKAVFTQIHNRNQANPTPVHLSQVMQKGLIIKVFDSFENSLFPNLSK